MPDVPQEGIYVLMLADAYRRYGYLRADLDPLGLTERPEVEELDPGFYGFDHEDLDREIKVDDLFGFEAITARNAIAALERTYCSTLGVEFMHIADSRIRTWVQEKFETSDPGITCPSTKREILLKLVEADGFEKFIALKYPKVGRYGLDGGESFIPALSQMIQHGHKMGISEIVLGMPHRGRLNVMAQVLGKPCRAFFHELGGGLSIPDIPGASGDVKYHLGMSSDHVFSDGTVHLSLAANPSHLEIVNPVVAGKARAKQDHYNHIRRNADSSPVDRSTVLPLLVHGDAAFTGQGVVAELFSLYGLEGYETGGSIHLIVNNQIGFTTNPSEGRSSLHTSDLAKAIGALVLHVNGDDPEMVVFASRLAVEYRQEFHKPVVINMLCYRRFGHNENDDPTCTQPVMYRAISRQKSTLQIYADKLLSDKVIEEKDLTALEEEWLEHLNSEYENKESYEVVEPDMLGGRWSSCTAKLQAGDTASVSDDAELPTGVPEDSLRRLGLGLLSVPSGFKLHDTVAKMFEERREALISGEGITWNTAEMLAFASLLEEGYGVRLAGEDCERGTFSQRHAVLYDQETGETHVPFDTLSTFGAAEDNTSINADMDREEVTHKYGRCEITNSMLSEEAVLAFEYGYSLVDPNTLTMWEAQFGDFANGAQIVFDQFISSGESKWLRMSGLVCLLPHGYEGRGPEHSSARLERHLQMCANGNIQVANCTVPANYFHLLRRQLKRSFRKPLILMAPKSLLRHSRCVSSLSDMGVGSGFVHLPPDDAASSMKSSWFSLRPDKEIERLVLCSGKVYHDLYEERERCGRDDVYLLRIEQLYPVPFEHLVKELSRFNKSVEVIWCQEESENMGAWSFIGPYISRVLNDIGHVGMFRYVGRAASAAPATGFASVHQAQQAQLVGEAIAL